MIKIRKTGMYLELQHKLHIWFITNLINLCKKAPCKWYISITLKYSRIPCSESCYINWTPTSIYYLFRKKWIGWSVLYNYKIIIERQEITLYKDKDDTYNDLYLLVQMQQE